ncbi:MAG: hypothetical protein PHQ74_06470 [Crocinitomicaceae bacterium]|nr:hypothetical protein [Crocinitomicaceae bacterium]
MKILIPLIFVLIELSCFSQDFNYFDFEKRFDWSPYEHVSAEILKSNFKLLKEKPYPELKHLLDNKDKFHLVDIDNDQINEVIYNGWNGGEGEMVVIFKLSKNQLVEVQNFYGRILAKRKNEMNQTQLLVLDYSCCAGYVDHLQTFDFNLQTGQFEIVKAIVKLTDTEIPKERIESKRFEVLNTPYYLRHSPEFVSGISDIDFEFKPLVGQNIGQNIAAIYQKGDQGTVYSETTDSTGRVWWFVVMDSKPDFKNMLFYDGNNEFDDYQPIGWMSSKFLKELE